MFADDVREGGSVDDGVVAFLPKLQTKHGSLFRLGRNEVRINLKHSR